MVCVSFMTATEAYQIQQAACKGRMLRLWQRGTDLEEERSQFI